MRLSHLLIPMLAVGGGLWLAAAATETENQGMRILPARGAVTVDGRLDDWDLAGGIFAVSDVENLRDLYGVWFHAMYDARHVYLLARWNDPAPLNNPGSSNGDLGFQGDCLQVRFITHYEGRGGGKEQVTHLTCWRDRDGADVVDVAYGRDFNQGNLRDAQEQGAQQEFSVYGNGKGYCQEIAIPWGLLTADGAALAAGAEMRMALEPNYTAGAGGRVSIKDIFQPNIMPDRVFTFRAYANWGTATLEKPGTFEPRPLRLADGREFPVRMANGLPVVDWSGLIAVRELAGFKPIRFSMPIDGYLSLNLFDAEGRVVRQLLNWAFYAKGEHEVKWDGLTTPYWRQPGEPAAAGEYIWRGLVHPGIGLRLRGWACNGGKAPWDNGPDTNWGGDHGVPSACATDGAGVFLGWTGAEAGKAVVACDLEGKVRWKQIRGGLGGAGLLGVDAGIVYVVDHERVLYRLDAATGGYSNWEGRPNAEMAVSALWEDAAGMPDRVEGMDAADGKVYVTCSSAAFRLDDAKDWKSLLGKVIRKEGLGAAIFPRLQDHWQRRSSQWGEDGPADLDAFCEAPNYYTPDFRADVTDILNRMLREDGQAANLADDARAQANRLAIEAALPGEFLPLQTNFVAVLDGRTGRLERRLEVRRPRAIHAVRPDLIGVVANDGTELVAVNPQTGTVAPLLTGLRAARGVTTDAAGRWLVSCGHPVHQILICGPEGQPAGSIGREGGRAALGPWQADGLRLPAGLTVDGAGHLWVAEATVSPKRISVWDLSNGRLLKEFFGPTHYGASGGAINPRDPNLMVGEGCEWRIAPQTGRATCLGVIDDALHSSALFAEGGNGRQYLFTSGERGTFIEIRERLGDGHYMLRASVRPDTVGKTTAFWADGNGDAEIQPAEVQPWPDVLRFAGYLGWSINANADMTLYATGEKQKAGVQLRVGGFTACGAPTYDLAGAAPLPPLGGALPTRDNRRVLSVTENWFECWDVASGERLWTYPNTFSGVHGSHRAPPPEPGLTRGAFGVVGNAALPPPVGNLWAINGNLGEWYLFTEDGFFLSRLFQGDPFKQQFPDQAVPGAILDACPPGLGGEDFGGSLCQAADGKVYIQAGKTALWNIEVVGLEKVAALPGGRVTLAAADLDAARRCREEQLQAAEGGKAYTLRRATPTFTGRLDQDFKAEKIGFKKQDNAAVRVAAAWDDQFLYVAWEVRDETPWVNGADAPEFMYARGDTVDLQLGTDPAAPKDRAEPGRGDLRVSIGNFQGRPTAVLYRKVCEVRNPKTFSSGVVKEYAMDYVDVVADARVEVKVDEEGRRYVVEAALPLAALGLKPSAGLALRGDFGVTHGDRSGADTALRTHWNNQRTGLVNDEVFELKMEPTNWGKIVFQP